MQAELFETLSNAYAAHVAEKIQALNLIKPVEEFETCTLNTRKEQMEFIERFEAADRDFEKMKLDRIKMAHVRDDGFRVGRLHGEKSECPYLPMSVEYLFWYRGWCQARNVFPITEIPMKDVFALDRPVTRFKMTFRVDDLIEKCAERILRKEHPEIPWSSMSPLAKKPYLVKAVSFLEVLMDQPSPSSLPRLESESASGSSRVVSD